MLWGDGSAAAMTAADTAKAAVICHFGGYALWHVSPESTTWIILADICRELSLMFSVAGFTADQLPKDKGILPDLRCQVCDPEKISTCAVSCGGSRR